MSENRLKSGNNFEKMTTDEIINSDDYAKTILNDFKDMLSNAVQNRERLYFDTEELDFITFSFNNNNPRFVMIANLGQ